MILLMMVMTGVEVKGQIIERIRDNGTISINETPSEMSKLKGKKLG
jgi:hypothetical protein